MARTIEQAVVDRLDRAAQRAGELGGGVACALRSLGVDEVDDRLRLGEIHLAVQEGALRKFAGSRLPCARAERGAQHLAEHHG